MQQLRAVVRATRSQNWCGPTAIAALTGLTYDESSEAIRKFSRRRKVTGTTSWEVLSVLKKCGYTKQTTIRPRDDEGKLLTFNQYLRRRGDLEKSNPILINAGHHWIVVLRNKAICSLTRSQPVKISEYKHKKVRVKNVNVLERTKKPTKAELRQVLGI